METPAANPHARTHAHMLPCGVARERKALIHQNIIVGQLSITAYAVVLYRNFFLESNLSTAKTIIPKNGSVKMKSFATGMVVGLLAASAQACE